MIVALGDYSKDENWLLDSNASSHMTLEVNNLPDIQEYSGNNFITIGNDLGLPISQIGTMKIKIDDAMIPLRLLN